MPAKGKHRRVKTRRFSRSIAIAGTGGAAIALPLTVAAGAHAATPSSATQSVSEKTVQAAPVAVQKTAAKTYTVEPGDFLAKIADEQHVSGGWKKLYEDNRAAVGSDPSLIHPGLKLTIGAKAASGGGKSSAAPKPSTAPKSSAAPKSSTASKSSSAPKSSAAKKADTGTEAVASNVAGFTLPIQGASVGTPYRMSGSMWSSGYHTGVDFAAPTGTSLEAVGAGTVVSAGWGGAYGNQVVIQLDDGKYAQYAHLSSLSVSAGQRVAAGQQVGLSGATGNVTGPHLHFEIRTGPDYGSDIDPLAYLRSKGVSI
ncbi:M23 family metallopeptidase [Streptomyces cavernae]|uniref:M23 family metallopeptidase n=1 Tax=Streptomyces cavernae TaxID=2259034 RepID=UPI000FEBDEF0|nr:M23 family metallopeptidase [Streptomyces cavernae]